MNALERIVASTRKDLARRRQAVPLETLQATAAARWAEGNQPSEQPARFAQALAGPGVSLIAEHKRRSPSAGPIREDLTLEAVVQAYERGGAAALSILTEGPNFGGSLADLQAARATATLPILRKDFIVDAYQLLESLLAGADAILLIVAALSAGELAGLHGRALELGLTALVEIHNERELEAALRSGASVIGINNRDLTTLTVNAERTFELAPRISRGMLVVAESGLSRRQELDELAQAGVNAVLVGEALMRSGDIEAACRALAGQDPGPQP